MTEYTQNYHLKKPSEDDFYDIADFNGNSDLIDSAINDKADADLANVDMPQLGFLPLYISNEAPVTADSQYLWWQVKSRRQAVESPVAMLLNLSDTEGGDYQIEVDRTSYTAENVTNSTEELPSDSYCVEVQAP